MLQVYLTDLAAYNAGTLVGKWVKLPTSSFELSQAISEILTEGEYAVDEENHEEYFITDYEWVDASLFEVEEYSNIFELNLALEALENLEVYQHKAIAFLMSQGLASNLTDATQKVDDVVIHENQSMIEIASSLIEECYDLDNVPDLIASHIDYEGIARDLEFEGSYYRVDNDVYEHVG